jgi:hypothetical protein
MPIINNLDKSKNLMANSLYIKEKTLKNANISNFKKSSTFETLKN